MSAEETQCQLAEVYGKDVSLQSEAKWCAELWGRRVSTDDCERSGKRTSARTTDNSASMEDVIHTNRRNMVSDLQHYLDLSHETLINIIQNLGFIKVCLSWVPQALMKGSQEMSGTCCHVCNDILSRISQAHCYNIYNMWSPLYPGDKTHQHGMGNTPVLHNRRSSRLEGPLTKWWLWCCGVVVAWRDNHILNFYTNIYCCYNEYMDELQSVVPSLVAV
jgi:hypothetical protein